MPRFLVESAILLGIAAVATPITFWLHPNAPSLYIQMEPLKQNEVTLEQIKERWDKEVIGDG